MSFIVAAVFLFFAFITLAICGGFIANSASRIAEIPNYDQNSKLNTARNHAIWASVIAWITVALIIVIGVFYIYYSGKNMGIIDDIITYGLFFICFIAVVIVGILSAMTASNINSSGVSDNNGSYKQAVIAGVLGIIVFVILLVALIIRIVSKVKKTYSNITGRPLNLAEIKNIRNVISPNKETYEASESGSPKILRTDEGNSGSNSGSNLGAREGSNLKPREESNLRPREESNLRPREETNMNPRERNLGEESNLKVGKSRNLVYDTSDEPGQFNETSKRMTKQYAKERLGIDIPDRFLDIFGDISERIRKENLARDRY